ncbi:MAG: TAXI family TRAP transporter solute-binding subunit [Fluviibacter sp.]
MNKNRGKRLPPKVSGNYGEILAEELMAFWSFLVSNWMYILPGLILAAVLIYFVRPLPPKTVRIATGQPNTTFATIGHLYEAEFKKHGVQLELVPSKGAGENMALLQSGQVDAVFTQGGLAFDDHKDEFRSLGSIAYQPLWLFYRGPEVEDTDLNHFLAHRRTSINIPGSGTRPLVEAVFQAHGITVDAPNLIGLDSTRSVQALEKGDIDAIVLVGSMESLNIQELTKTAGVHIYNFSLAEAYAKRFKYLDPVVFPRGAISFHPVSPAQDIHMLSTTVDILTTNHLHPAIQLLFLEAASDFDRNRTSFFSNGKFPAYMDNRIPESDVARRYFKEGTPLLWGYVPFWLASLFDEIWFYLLAISAIVIPAISLLPSYRKNHAVLSIESCYGQLRQIENALLKNDARANAATLLQQINDLSLQVRKLWVPTGNRTAYYDLRSAVNIVRVDILDLMQTEATDIKLADLPSSHPPPG